ncbi:MAG: tetratricopeptide repeat protein, partial [Candidatus Margulisbacteria bacterium]|nr:tetratricopeptide repeat protein [Candidatus Margulisiibacteriota bacterium]
MASIFVVFYPLFTGYQDFLYWDDWDYIVLHDGVKGLSWDHLKWIMTSKTLGVYEPISRLIKNIVYFFFSLSPRAFQLTGLFFHTANGFLMWAISVALFRHIWPSRSRMVIIVAGFFSALFFAIHPLRAEVVAWVSAQAYAVSTCFVLLGIGCYIQHRQQEKEGSKWYWLTLGAYVCACMSKTVGIILPCLLVGLDYFPFRRHSAWKSIVEKWPFWITAFIFGSLAMWATHGAQPDGAIVLTFTQKIGRASYSIFFYIINAFWPRDLLAHYQIPVKELSMFNPTYFMAFLGCVGVTVLSWVKRHQWPWLVVLWGAYIVTLLPVLGIVQHGALWMSADRYTYISLLGLSLVVGSSLLFINQIKWHIGMGAVVLSFVIGLGIHAVPQVKTWQNTETVWQNVLRVNPDNTMALNNLGFYYLRFREYDKAEPLLKWGVELEPGHIKMALNYGMLLERQDKVEEAIEALKRSIAFLPQAAFVYYNLGIMNSQLGKEVESQYYFTKAYRINPRLDEAIGSLQHLHDGVTLR